MIGLKGSTKCITDKNKITDKISIMMTGSMSRSSFIELRRSLSDKSQDLISLKVTSLYPIRTYSRLVCTQENTVRSASVKYLDDGTDFCLGESVAGKGRASLSGW
jgi:hypothetical protein